MFDVKIIIFTSIFVMSLVYIYNFEHKRNQRKLFIKEVDEGIKRLDKNVDSCINKRVIVKK